jgi:hypothetical protein
MPLGSDAFLKADARSRAETVAGLVSALASLPLGRQDKFLLLRSSLQARLIHPISDQPSLLSMPTSLHLVGHHAHLLPPRTPLPDPLSPPLWEAPLLAARCSSSTLLRWPQWLLRRHPPGGCVLCWVRCVYPWLWGRCPGSLNPARVSAGVLRPALRADVVRVLQAPWGPGPDAARGLG